MSTCRARKTTGGTPPRAATGSLKPRRYCPPARPSGTTRGRRTGMGPPRPRQAAGRSRGATENNSRSSRTGSEKRARSSTIKPSFYPRLALTTTTLTRKSWLLFENSSNRPTAKRLRPQKWLAARWNSPALVAINKSTRRRSSSPARRTVATKTRRSLSAKAKRK